MKRTIIFLLLLCSISLYIQTLALNNVGVIITYHNANEQEAIKFIEEFYKRYMANFLSDQSSSAFHPEKYLTNRLIQKVERISLVTGANPIIRAQDLNEYAQTTLTVKHLEKNWYMVEYRWSDNDPYTKIPVMVAKVNGQYKIDYITPEWNGIQYGDNLLCNGLTKQSIDTNTPLSFIKTFYSTYLFEYSTMQENLETTLMALRNKHLTPDALAQFEASANEQKSDGYPNYDLLIDNFDFDCLWLSSLEFAPAGTDTFRVKYTKGKTPYTIIIKLSKYNGEYQISEVSLGL